MTYTRSQIKENRIKWANFLTQPERKKANGSLDIGNEERCCLGHGCAALGVVITSQEGNKIWYGAMGDNATAPDELIDMVGLWDLVGWFGDTCSRNSLMYKGETHASLAAWNDDSDVTPQEIGAYLLTVIEGGDGTPFRPLSEYPEE